MASKSMSKSTSMSKQQSGPNPWAVAGLAALGGGVVAATGVGIYHHVHGKDLANSDNIAGGEALIAQLQAAQAGQQ